jgi:lipoprotein NlpI
MPKTIALLCALLFIVNVSRSQADEAVNDCTVEAPNKNLDGAIAQCTAVIESGKLSNQELALALVNRGLGNFFKTQYDRAISDYDRALGIEPRDARALHARADAYLEKRNYERALADYDAATQNDPKFIADRSKGLLFFYLGWMTQSAEMFERHMKSEPDDLRIILFRYLVEAKIGNALAAARDLERQAANAKDRSWPAPIIDFHVGKIDEKTMFAAANDADPRKKIEKTCSASFHAGEARLLRANITSAIPLLRAAEKGCPPDFYEAHAAATELKRMGQK